MTDTPEWLQHNSRGMDFGRTPIVLRETEHYALAKVPGHWAKLTAYGQSYVAVHYLLMSKAYHRGNMTGWYRYAYCGRPSTVTFDSLIDKLNEAERTDSLPPHSESPRMLITNHR